MLPQSSDKLWNSVALSSTNVKFHGSITSLQVFLCYIKQFSVERTVSFRNCYIILDLIFIPIDSRFYRIESIYCMVLLVASLKILTVGFSYGYTGCPTKCAPSVRQLGRSCILNCLFLYRWIGSAWKGLERYEISSVAILT